MKIGDYAVTDVTRENALVGCQLVTKEQVEELLAAMKNAPEGLKFSLGSTEDHHSSGTMWLRYLEGSNQSAVIVMLASKYNGNFAIARIDANGITPINHCRACGLPTSDDFSHSVRVNPADNKY